MKVYMCICVKVLRVGLKRSLIKLQAVRELQVGNPEQKEQRCTYALVVAPTVLTVHVVEAHRLIAAEDPGLQRSV